MNAYSNLIYNVYFLINLHAYTHSKQLIYNSHLLTDFYQKILDYSLISIDLKSHMISYETVPKWLTIDKAT